MLGTVPGTETVLDTWESPLGVVTVMCCNTVAPVRKVYTQSFNTHFLSSYCPCSMESARDKTDRNLCSGKERDNKQ